MNESVRTLIDALDFLPNPHCLVDINSRYIHYNLPYIKMIGAEHLPRFSLVGKTVAEMPNQAADCANFFWKEDELVIKTKKMVTILNILKMENDNWWVIQIDKTPIFNKNNQIEAILFSFFDLSSNHLLKLANSIGKSYQNIEPKENVLLNLKYNSEDITLGKKEAEILFYLIHGMPYKAIAAKQNIAYSTIIDHIERLKIKFSANSTDELINKAVIKGYPKTLPQGLFDRQFSIILIGE